MSRNTIIIGVAGASASGKSLLANRLAEEFDADDVAIIPEDAYYKHNAHLTFEERTKVNYDHPDALEHDLLHKHLMKLLKGEEVEIPEYDFSQHLRKDTTRRVGNHRIIVLEGILLFVEKEMRDIMDIKIFMDTALDICLLRRIHRDVIDRGRSIDGVMKQYEQTVRPMYLQFIEPSKRYADVIVPRGGQNQIAVDMIKAKMRELL